MNEKALELGLENTSFADPSGLNPDNVSSAYDLSRLISFAARDERIAPIMRTPTYTVTTNRRTITIHSTNQLRDGRRRRRDGRQDRLHQQVRLLPGDAAAPARRATRSRSSSSARTSNNGRFWETRHLFNWLSEQGVGDLRQEQRRQSAAAASRHRELQRRLSRYL